MIYEEINIKRICILLFIKSISGETVYQKQTLFFSNKKITIK